LARKILLADDSVTAQNMGRKILTEAGYEVITVNNGSSALKKATEAKPDLIILDVYMPGYGGLEVCQRIKDTPESARIPILLSVGKLEPFKADEARRAGADAHIVKPFEASELLAAINKLEDRIVPQGIARRPGRSTRISVEGGPELRDGWKDRLPTPISKGKKPTTDWEEPEGSAAPEAKPANTNGDAEPAIAARADSTADAPPTAEFAIASATAETGKAEEKDVDPQTLPATEIAHADEPETPVALAAATAAETAPTGETAGATETAGNLAESEVAAALASLGGNDQGTASRSGAFMRDEAATMVGPRWIAEEVALTDDETNCVLEHEMEKALAAMAAAEAAAVEAAQTTSSSQETAASSQKDHVKSAGQSAPVDASESLTCELKAQEPGMPSAENAPVEAVAHAAGPSAIPASAEAENEPRVSAAQPLAAFAAAASAGGTFEGSRSEVSAMPQESSQSGSPASGSSSPAVGETEDEPQLHEAWTNWKQIRESVIGSQLAVNLAETAELQVAESQVPESRVPESQFPESQFKDIRREAGVSASQPQPAQEAAAADPDEAAAIASAVDSVLADLKPKLMEEIAKKMRKGKK
jgi:CheY-like chemotaxis protein